MLRSIKFTFTDGAFNPECHVETQQALFHSDGSPAGSGGRHVAVVAVADGAGLDGARLTVVEVAAVAAQLARVRADWPAYVAPAFGRV